MMRCLSSQFQVQGHLTTIMVVGYKAAAAQLTSPHPRLVDSAVVCRVVNSPVFLQHWRGANVFTATCDISANISAVIVVASVGALCYTAWPRASKSLSLTKAKSANLINFLARERETRAEQSRAVHRALISLSPRRACRSQTRPDQTSQHYTAS